jgi:aspartate kinase
VVYKFGGTSLADAERVAHVARLVAEGPASLVVVVSALGGVTDHLVALCGCRAEGDAAEASTIVGKLRTRHLDVVANLGLDAAEATSLVEAVEVRLTTLLGVAAGPESPDRDDALLSAGEDLSTLLVAAAVRQQGRDATVVDARRVVETDDRHGHAVPDGTAIRSLAREILSSILAAGIVPVLQGFVGATPDGVTTTLGRGGSDFTAALLGGALDAETVHIWTDVAGIMTGDPREVDAPYLLDEIGFEEAVELSWSGAKVIHPVAAKWAVSQGVPLRIRSTFQPEHPGTLIRNDVRNVAEIAAVVAKKNVALIKVRSHPAALPYGFLARVFEILARYRLEVDLVATSHSSTAFTIDEAAELDDVARELSVFSDVDVRRDLSTVTVVGRGLMAEPGMDALVFLAVESAPVHMISQASDVSLGFVVDAANAPDLVRRLHTTLIEEREASARRSA